MRHSHLGSSMVMLAPVPVLLFGFVLTVPGQGDTNALVLPYERTSLDDCHVRFYRLYGKLPNWRVIFGQAALLREFAHIAAIGWMDAATDGKVQWRCGGSLIWDNFILTAAHCTVDDNGQPPDVARMGDINIESDEDDQYAQERQIVDIIRHPEHRFSARYNDVALLKLERKVRIHDTVAPTCLWLDEDVPFPKLLAAGWGATGISAKTSPILLKVELNTISNDNCSKHHLPGQRKLRAGLQNDQMCAGDTKMDLCPGDSGGPLHVNLMYDGYTTPFLVGVTSFGKACGLSVPGVYARVSKFVDWIVETLRKHGEPVTRFTFEPLECVKRHAATRELEYVDAVEGLTYTYDKNYMDLRNNEHTVRVRWPNAVVPARTDCLGTLVEPDVVLTLAQCASHLGIRPNRVTFPDGAELTIREVIVHPNYTQTGGGYYNNIAVLKLASFASIVPACGWYSNDVRAPIAQLRGRRKIPKENNEAHEYAPLIAQTWRTAHNKCDLAEPYASLLPRGLHEEHLCFHDRHHIVPGTCDLEPGAAIERLEYPTNYILGLNMFGPNCGFGHPAVGVRLATHKAWLESVLLPSADDFLLYIDSDLQMGDACTFPDGTQGVCVRQDACPNLERWSFGRKPMVFCRVGSVVCCPRTDPIHRTSEIEKELHECDVRYRHLRRKLADGWYTIYEACGSISHLPHVVELGWKRTSSDTAYECYGYLITTRGVVTSASCVRAKSDPPNVVRLGALWSNNMSQPIVIDIEAVVIHPRFRAMTLAYNVAVVRLRTPIEPNESVYPGCLWLNTTHSPVIQQVLNGERQLFSAIHPVYRSDCESQLNRSFAAPEAICMIPGLRIYRYNDEGLGVELEEELYGQVQNASSNCYQPGSPVVWRKCVIDEEITEYLVSVYSHGGCDVTSLRIVERVALYIDWLKEALA